MKPFAQSLVFCTAIAGAFFGALFGLAGASAVADYFYGPGALSMPAPPTPSFTMLVLDALMLLGMLIGAVGALAILVLPLHFAFPLASRRFWQGVTSSRGLLSGHVRRLRELVDEPQ